MAAITSLTEAAIIALINEGSFPQEYPDVTGTLTSTTDPAIVVDVREAQGVAFHFKNGAGTTMTAGTFVWEASLDSTNGTDGTWFPVQAATTTTTTPATSVAVTSLASLAGQPNAWKANVSGFKYFRIRCSVNAVNGITFWTIQRAPFAFEPAPAIQTHAVTQSGTWNVTGSPASGSAIGPLTSAATINALSIKSSAGNLDEISIFNGSAATVYVKFWNKASIPVPSTDAALLAVVIPVPAGQIVNQEFGPLGKRFTTGIAFAMTAAVAATDATAIGTGVIVSGTFL